MDRNLNNTTEVLLQLEAKFGVGKLARTAGDVIAGRSRSKSRA
jgi:hypothetical protein